MGVSSGKLSCRAEFSYNMRLTTEKGEIVKEKLQILTTGITEPDKEIIELVHESKASLICKSKDHDGRAYHGSPETILIPFS